MFVYNADTASSWVTSVLLFVHHPAVELCLLVKALSNIGWNDEAYAALFWFLYGSPNVWSLRLAVRLLPVPCHCFLSKVLMS